MERCPRKQLGDSQAVDHVHTLTYRRIARSPSSIQIAVRSTVEMLMPAPDFVVVAAGLLPVAVAPPLLEADGMLDGDELPALSVALPSARKIM